MNYNILSDISRNAALWGVLFLIAAALWVLALKFLGFPERKSAKG